MIELEILRGELTLKIARFNAMEQRQDCSALCQSGTFREERAIDEAHNPNPDGPMKKSIDQGNLSPREEIR
jgi:hypothetical protein